MHSTKNEIDSALSKYLRVKSFYENEKGRDNIAFVNSEIASLYYNNQMPKIALPYALTALKYTDTTLFSRQSISTYEILHHIYGDLKDYKNEVKFLKLYMAASDSIDNVETLNEINKNEMLIQFNTAHVTDSIKGVEDLKNKDLKIQSKKNQSYFLIVLLLITFSAMGLIYSRFKVTKKQKNIIEEQKGLVEEKQKEIIDSIKYAKRIQSSLLPTEKYIDKSIKRLNIK